MIPGTKLGEKFANAVVILCCAVLVIWIGWALLSGTFARWQRDRAVTRADTAEQTAKVSQRNADSANAGASNATQTRAAVTDVRIDATGFAGAVAAQIESKAQQDQDLPADDDVLDALNAQEARIAKQARRVRGRK